MYESHFNSLYLKYVAHFKGRKTAARFIMLSDTEAHEQDGYVIMNVREVEAFGYPATGIGLSSET